MREWRRPKISVKISGVLDRIRKIRHSSTSQKFVDFYFEKLKQSSSSFTLITTGRIETYQIATYSIRTLLKMDYWSPKHVELLNVMNKINHQILCILLDYIYIAKWYTVHTISNMTSSSLSDMQRRNISNISSTEEDAHWHCSQCCCQLAYVKIWN